MKVALVILGLFAAAQCAPLKNGAEGESPVVAKTETAAVATKTSGESTAHSSSSNEKRALLVQTIETADPEDAEGNVQARRSLLMTTGTDGDQPGTQIISTRSLTSQTTDAKSDDLEGIAIAEGKLTLTKEPAKAAEDKDHARRSILTMISGDSDQSGTQIISTRSLTSQTTDAKSDDTKEGISIADGKLTLTQEEPAKAAEDKDHARRATQIFTSGDSDQSITQIIRRDLTSQLIDTTATSEDELSEPKTTRAVLQTTNAEGKTAVSSANLENKGEKGTIAQQTSAKGHVAIATSKLVNISTEEKKPLAEGTVSSPVASEAEGAAAPATTEDKAEAPAVASPTTILVNPADQSIKIHKS